MKKLISALLSICLCLATVFSFVCCGQTSDISGNGDSEVELPEMPVTPSEGLEYQLTEDGTGYIFTGTGNCMDANIRIADEYNSLPVVKIGENAFNSVHGGMISLTIGKNISEVVTGIESPISHLSLQAFFVVEGNTAYKGMDENLYTADGSVLIKYAVESTRESYVLPETVVEIQDNAFNGSKNITSLTIPEGVEVIEDYAFTYCRKLNSIQIPSTVSSLGKALTEGSQISEISVAEGNAVYKAIDGVLYTKDGKELLEYPAAKQDESFSVPEGVVTIKAGSFTKCKLLKNIVLPMSVRTIENSAFAGCSGLESAELTFGIEAIEAWAFGDCVELKSIKLTFSLYRVDDNAFNGCTKLSQIFYDADKNIWEMMSYNYEWMDKIPLEKVVCTDGEIVIE